MDTRVSIIIPVFNSETTLCILTERLSSALSGRFTAFEVIMVDDCSQDNSWEVITTLAERYTWLTGVRLAQNIGQYSATLLGLRYARHPISVTMDDDLQHPPEAIPTLLAALTPGINIVYAAPQNSWKPALYRMIVTIAKYAIAIVCGAPFLRYKRSFRAIQTECYPWSNLSLDRPLSPDGLLKSIKPKARVVHVLYGQRLAGRSSYTWKRSAKLLLIIWRSSHEPYPSKQGKPPLLSDVTGWLMRPENEEDFVVTS